VGGWSGSAVVWVPLSTRGAGDLDDSLPLAPAPRCRRATVTHRSAPDLTTLLSPTAARDAEGGARGGSRHPPVIHQVFKPLPSPPTAGSDAEEDASGGSRHPPFIHQVFRPLPSPPTAGSDAEDVRGGSRHPPVIHQVFKPLLSPPAAGSDAEEDASGAGGGGDPGHWGPFASSEVAEEEEDPLLDDDTPVGAARSFWLLPFVPCNITTIPPTNITTVVT